MRANHYINHFINLAYINPKSYVSCLLRIFHFCQLV
jgi:hypothetical protein